MRLIGGIIAAASVLFYSGTSFALFDVEALVGKRWYKFENTGADSTNVSSQEIALAVHIDPIPLIPVGFGLGVLAGDLNKDDFKSAGSDVSEAALLEVDFEVKAWLPMVPVVTPYLKVKVPLTSKLAVKGKSGTDDFAYTAKLTGYHANLGLQYPIIPLVAVNLEFGKGMQKAEIEEYKLAGQKVDLGNFKKENANSDNVMLGVQVGF